MHRSLIFAFAATLALFAAYLSACSAEKAPAPEPRDTADADQATRATPAETEPPDGIAYLGTNAVRYTALGWDNTRHPGRAVVLIHGWASDRSVWTDQLEPLAAHARVIAIDLPGHGRSDLPSQRLTMDLFADAIDAVLEDTGITSAVLVGHSNGTPTIRQFYRNYRRKAAALVVVDGALKRMFGDETAEQFRTSLGASDYQDFVTTMVVGMASSSPTPEDLRARVLPMALATPHRSVVEAFLAGADASIWLDDPIEVPTLVVLADAPFWTDDYKQHVRNLVRAPLEYHTLPGVSHYLQMDAPETFNTLLLDFLRTIEFVDS